MSIFRNRQLALRANLIWVILFSLTAAALTAFGQVDVVDLRTQLLNRTGAEYVQARDIALSMPASDFAELLALLDLAEPISQDRIIAMILRFRKENPEIAATFDQRLALSLQTPDLTFHDGKPKYFLRWDSNDPDFGPIRFEAFLKLEFPSNEGGALLRNSLISNLRTPNRAYIDPLLWLATQRGMGFVERARYAAEGLPQEQARITPIIVELHKHWRQQGQIASSAIHVLEHFGTQLQLDALYEIRAFEQQKLAADGIDPSNEEGYTKVRSAIAAKMHNAEETRHIAEMESVTGRQPKTKRELDKLAAIVDEHEHELRTIDRQLATIRMWDQLERSIATLDTRLSP